MGGQPSKDMQQMQSWEWNGADKVAIVTGPTGGPKGIGWHTAKWLAERGAHVVLAGRSLPRLAECAAQIRAAARDRDGKPIPPEQLTLSEIALDLTSLTSVEQFVAAFTALGKPLHILINNAGVMDCPYSHTADGFEMQIGTNHVGHHYLTKLLLPSLLAGAPSRVVCVASMAHRAGNLDASKLDDTLFRPTAKQYSGWRAYGNSKLANILLARSLQSKYGAQGVSAFSLHPGVVATDLGRQQALNRFFYKFGSFAMKTPEAGAGTQLYCATSPEALLHAGGYHDCCAFTTSASARATDDALAEALWVATEREIEAWKARREAAPAAAPAVGAPVERGPAVAPAPDIAVPAA